MSRSMTDDIRILSEPIRASESIEFVADAQAGGIDLFLGTSRAERRADGVELVALHYEAYEQMALEQMRKLVADARQRWPIAKCVLLHRTGRVGLAEASVLIAVSCPHRGQAFDACRFLIDELKKSVTIWKREVWADESTSWVDPAAPK